MANGFAGILADNPAANPSVNTAVNTVSPLTTTSYTVTVTNANGCTSTNQSTVQEPNEIVSGSIVRVTNVDCTGETNGSISAEAAGGTGELTIDWGGFRY